VSGKARDYDSTVARMAGNILSGLAGEMVRAEGELNHKAVVWAVTVARAIIAEVKRTEVAPDAPADR
jgi:fatty acid/phospholipid biosynthesis enzyme